MTRALPSVVLIPLSADVCSLDAVLFVWEVDDIDEARAWLAERGLRIRFEYDSGRGNLDERRSHVDQLVLDQDEWFGFNITLMRRTTPTR